MYLTTHASLTENLTIIAVTVGAMILMRAVAILSVSKLSNLLQPSEITLPEETILWWGGVRGSVSLAKAIECTHNSSRARKNYCHSVWCSVIYLAVPEIDHQTFITKA